jgi:predicted DNA-binding transcriptional regulator YafY
VATQPVFNRWNGFTIERTLKVLRLLMEAPYSPAELIREIKSDELFGGREFSKYTIYDDIKRLRTAGFTVIYDPKIKKYRLQDVPFKLDLTEKELLALATATEAILSQERLPYQPELASAMAKINTLLPEKLKEKLKLNPLVKFILRPVVDYRPYVEVIEALRQAIGWRRLVQLEYFNPRLKEITTYTLAPLDIYFDRHALYLFAYSKDSGKVKDFRVDRIRKISLLPSRYPPLHKIDTVKVRFKVSAEIACMIGEIFPGQEVERLKDGSIIVTAEVASYFWAMQQILSFGQFAEVLEPKKFRDEMACVTAAMSKKYF